ncbi:cation:proton antiporter [Streptantibioticus ferralitis]|uniref:Cation:proton antiporter n=1 Tax=Streptantibioticus ferralitis TaxID=236510 RepID=A0ABT5ZBL3_9ACTN|nr:cation:proton antiporter [Streptantibioticus ferralitis]MDF2261174.1 cation:proton antiporter [Streptantibioticus ferralitis]
MPSVTAPPLGGHALLVLLVQASLLLGVALLLGRIATRFKLPAVSGELTAGVLLGPSVLGRLIPGFHHWLQTTQASQVHLLDAVGQLGVILLVGTTALEIDPALVRRTGRTSLTVGAFGLLIPLGLGCAAGVVAPAALLPVGRERGLFALFIGVAMCVSALPVIAKMLSDMRLLHRDIAQLTIAVGVVDDVTGWMLLSVASATVASGFTLGSVAEPLCRLVLITVCATFLGRPAIRWLMARARSPQMVTGTATVVITGCAAATQAMDMEASFGALVGGLLVGAAGAETKRGLAPLRSVTLSVLAPLYFAEAGLRMDLFALGTPLIALAALCALVVATVGKFTGALLGARVARLDRRAALVLGAGMNARGVIQIIVAGIGLRLGVLNTASYTIVMLVAVGTSLMAPPVLRRAVQRIEVNDGERARLQRGKDLAGVS